MRLAARLELEDAIPFLSKVYRNKLHGVTASLGARVRAVDTLVRIGIPQQVEVQPPWDGDWSQFSPDELNRITAGEHPQQVLEARLRALPAPKELLIEKEEP